MNKNKIGIWLISMAILFQSTVSAGAVQQPTVILNGANLPEWKATISSYGGKLLLSDSPETVPDDGIMYQDTVNGDNRLFFHHVNGTSTPKKIVVLLENITDKPAHVTVYKYGLGGPSYDFLEVGKKVQLDYIEGKDAYLLDVPTKESISLIPSLDHAVVEPNMLVNGMYDFTTDQPVKVKVMMMPVDADVYNFAASAKVLPADVAQYRLRGTFDGKDRLVIPDKVYDATQDGVVAFTLADNAIDTYVKGIDATDGTKTTNYGNYGILYKIYVPSMAKGEMSYYLNPRGGEYAGWLGTKYRHQEVATIATPADQMSFGSKVIGESAYIGTYEGGKSLWLTFSPPGASNLPIKFIIKPSK
ncbi:copper amine oxidase [Pelosinus sp. sgz500959]|uniref:copper amine oxidase n=1 Tax=Pelosinus sp. sgz500959 TaxID=3242472 RepID=UPI00366D09EC